MGAEDFFMDKIIWPIMIWVILPFCALSILAGIIGAPFVLHTIYQESQSPKLAVVINEKSE